MKKLLGIVVLVLFWCSSVSSKIININQALSLDVPTNYEFIKIDDSNSSSVLYGMGEFFDELGNLELEFYIIAPRAAIDVVKELLDGTEAEDLDVFKTILRKAEKKKFNSYQSQLKWLVSELKKKMKKEKVSSITYAMVSKQKIKNIDDEEFIDLIKEIENMNESERKEFTDELRKEMTSLSRDNKTIPINEDTSLVIKKFKIAKNHNNKLFVEFNVILKWLNVVSIPGNLYLSERNEYLYLVASECWVNCSKFNSKFNKMIKPIISTNTQVQKTTSNISDSGDLTDQLKALNELYKSGALTEEEFTKAKKKLLN
tara:strand:+ start:28 stop:972 length:945 start_codon:yes stop_codon:yes gene_type:complete